MRDETASFHGRIEAVTAKLTETESLVDAFDGCNGVFHTSGFIDPSGISGYSVSSPSLSVFLYFPRLIIIIIFSNLFFNRRVFKTYLSLLLHMHNLPGDTKIIDHD